MTRTVGMIEGELVGEAEGSFEIQNKKLGKNKLRLSSKELMKCVPFPPLQEEKIKQVQSIKETKSEI